MIEYLKKFFGYIKEGDGIARQFEDNLGKGAFVDWRHYALIVLTILLPIMLYRIFHRHVKAGRLTIIVLSTYLFLVRLINQSVRAFIGAEYPALKALPFHMCTVMTFLLPIVVFFNFKKLKTAVYLLSMMGGIVTIIMGDYFDNAFINFSSLESIIAHVILIIVPIIDIAIGGFKIEWKYIWQVFVGILIILGWATLANEVIFRNYSSNYMYLKENGLPGNFGGPYYFLIYTAIFLIMLVSIFSIPSLYRYRQNKRKTTLLL